MKVRAMVLGSLVMFGAAAGAQEKAPTSTPELGFTYSYTRVNPGGGISSANANGGYGYAEYNVNRVFCLVAELGANHTGDAGKTLLGNTTFQYLFGPRFNWRTSRFTPYVQTLFGGERLSNGFNVNSATPRLLTAQNNFAAAFGGGVDVSVSNRFIVKPI